MNRLRLLFWPLVWGWTRLLGRTPRPRTEPSREPIEPTEPESRSGSESGEAAAAGGPSGGRAGGARSRGGDPALIVRVRQEAFAHARAGMYDQWSFDNATLPPYFAELRAEREREILRFRHDFAAELRASRSRLEDVDARADETDRTARVEEDRLRAAERQEEIVRSRLDWLSMAEVRRRPEPPGGPSPTLGDDADDADDAAAPSAAAPRTGCVHDRLPHECWEGLHEGEPMRANTRRWILLGLIGIDVPIQYEVFRHFHGDSVSEQIQTWIFTLPVAVIMIVLPHLAGYLYRKRHRTGTERIMYVLPLAILAPWAYLTWRLGTMRQKVLLAPPTGLDGKPVVDPNTGVPLPTPTDQLHLSPVTVGVMYMGLLVIAGGIAFLLGIAREHPIEEAYRRAYTALRDAQRAVAEAAPQARDAVSAQRQAHAAHQVLEREYQTRLEVGIEAIHASYDQAELAYLQALGEAVAEPPFTEAVGMAAQALRQAQAQPRPTPV